MNKQNQNNVNPIRKPKRRSRRKLRRRFNRDLQLAKIRQLVKEMSDREKYGLDRDDLRFRRIGTRKLWEFVLPEGSSVVNGVVFAKAQDGKVECLGDIGEFVGGLGK